MNYCRLLDKKKYYIPYITDEYDVTNETSTLLLFDIVNYSDMITHEFINKRKTRDIFEAI